MPDTTTVEQSVPKETVSSKVTIPGLEMAVNETYEATCFVVVSAVEISCQFHLPGFLGEGEMNRGRVGSEIYLRRSACVD